MSNPKAKGMQKSWPETNSESASKGSTTSKLERYKQMKIENINCKTLISNIIETSSIDTCNFCLETIMFCTTNQRLNIKSKCCGRHFVTPKFANFQAQQHRDKVPRAVKIYNRNKNKNIYQIYQTYILWMCFYKIVY